MTKRRIPLDFVPRVQFLDFHKRRQRWSVLICHRRCGKTYATLMDLMLRALRYGRDKSPGMPPGRYAYIAPLFNQAKTVAWDIAKEFTRPVMVGAPNEAELRIDILGGSRISLYGADNPDRLRGLGLNGVVLDEFADMVPSLFPSIVRPALADRQGVATLVGTIKGRNHLWQAYENALASPDWLAMLLKASQTGQLSQEELDSAHAQMSAEAYAAELECDPFAAIQGAFFGKEIAIAEAQGRITKVPVELALPIHCAWDLGVSDSTSIWVWQATADEVRVIDHYENHGQALPHYVAELKARGYAGATDHLPHDAKARSLATGRTLVETLIALGRRPQLVPAHKVMDGINAVRQTLPHAWFDAEKCRDGLEALRQYRVDYDEKTRAFKDTPRHDWSSHSADSFRYLAMSWRAIAAPVPGPPPKRLFIPAQEMTYTNRPKS